MRFLRWRELADASTACHAAYIAGATTFSSTLHGHDFYEVFWVDAGAGYHRLREGGHRLVPGMLVFVRSRDIHGFRREASSEPFGFFNVAFPARAWAELNDRYRLDRLEVFDTEAADPPVTRFRGAEAREVGRLFRSAVANPRTALHRDALLLGLAAVGTGRDDEDIARAPAWLRTVLMRFDCCLPEASAASLAESAGCSPAHLSRVMRKTLNAPPSEWIAERRLRRAASLLESTGLSVTDVAMESGFQNLSHFHRSFRRAFGFTPLRFRRERIAGIA